MSQMNEAPPERCTRCRNMPSLDTVTCTSCRQPKPPCGGCAVGWSQVQSVVDLGRPRHYCRTCTP